jgi:hypothetical protein
MKLPKFYNPFKAHIVEFANAKFAVRRLALVGFYWEYKENITFSSEDVYWWNWIEHTHRWCCVDTYEQAIALRDKVHIKQVKPTKVAKVHG